MAISLAVSRQGINSPNAAPPFLQSPRSPFFLFFQPRTICKTPSANSWRSFTVQSGGVVVVLSPPLPSPPAESHIHCCSPTTHVAVCEGALPQARGAQGGARIQTAQCGLLSPARVFPSLSRACHGPLPPLLLRKPGAPGASPNAKPSDPACSPQKKSPESPVGAHHSAPHRGGPPLRLIKRRWRLLSRAAPPTLPPSRLAGGCLPALCTPRAARHLSASRGHRLAKPPSPSPRSGPNGGSSPAPPPLSTFAPSHTTPPPPLPDGTSAPHRVRRRASSGRPGRPLPPLAFAARLRARKGTTGPPPPPPPPTCLPRAPLCLQAPLGSTPELASYLPRVWRAFPTSPGSFKGNGVKSPGLPC